MYHIANLDAKPRLLLADRRRGVKRHIVTVRKQYLLTDITGGIHIRQVICRRIQCILTALQTGHSNV